MCHHKVHSDLIDNRFDEAGQPRHVVAKPRKAMKLRSKLEAGMTGVKLYREDALRLRSRQASGGGKLSDFVRQAVRTALQQEAGQ